MQAGTAPDAIESSELDVWHQARTGNLAFVQKFFEVSGLSIDTVDEHGNTVLYYAGCCVQIDGSDSFSAVRT